MEEKLLKTTFFIVLKSTRHFNFFVVVVVGEKGDKIGGEKRAHYFGSSVFGCKPKTLA